ncbi:MAG: hypothetical protein AB7F43_07835 [Bacteriovoracia bacterium]
MIIYRGENLKPRPNNNERLRTLNITMRAGIAADFLNGGNPYTLEKLSFFDATVAHVAENFKIGKGKVLKHWVSFSGKEEKAFEYARGRKFTREEKMREASSLTYSYYGVNAFEQWIWDNSVYFITKLDISKRMPIHGHEEYLFTLSYNGCRSNLALIHATPYLEKQKNEKWSTLTIEERNSLDKALAFAKGDDEWLVRSIDLISEQPGVKPSASAIIDHGEVVEVVFYVDHEEYEAHNSARFIR